MRPFVAAAVLAVVMAVVAAVLAVTLSPWVLLAWPLSAVLFGVLVFAESRASRAAADVRPRQDRIGGRR